MVQSAWRLKANLERQAARDRSEPADDAVESSPSRIRPTELDQAARSLRDAIESLDYIKAWPRTTPAILPFTFDAEVDADLVPNEWPIVPCDDLDDLPEISEDSAADAVPSWQDRLVFDFDISDVSPVVKGTWITVGTSSR